MTEDIENELLYQAESRDHLFVGKGGPCYWCGRFQDHVKYSKCSLEQDS